MKKLFVTLLILLLTSTSAYAALTVGNLPKVKTGGGSPSVENSSLSETAGNLTATGTVTASSFVGNSSTTTALAADPANCSAGQTAGGVTAAGVAESCLDPIVSTEIDTSSELSGILTDEDGTGTCGTGAYCTGGHTHPTTEVSGVNAGTDLTADLEEEVTEGSLADSTIVSGDIKDGTITLADTAITAGRSLTISTNDILADAELYTDTKCIWWENPVAGDDFKSVWISDLGAVTVTKLWCESDQTVTAMLQVDDGSAADMDSVDLVCISTPDTDTSLDGDATLASGDRVDIDVASVASVPTWVSICFTYTKDD